MDNTYSYEVRFGRGRPIRFISHLDLMRVWERMFRRAQLPIAHSQGFNPRPQITFAAPLPVGVMSRGDLLETVLEERLPEGAILERLRAQAVPGLAIESVVVVAGKRKSLAARMRESGYEIRLPGVESEAAGQAVGELLARTEVPMRTERGGKVREYDLRPLVLALDLIGGPEALLCARLRHDPQATGRPDDLLRALGQDPAQAEVTRVELVLATPEGA